MAVLEVQETNDIVLYEIKDIQNILKIGKNTVYKLIKLPTFPVIRIGKKHLIPKTQFEEWVKNSIHKNLL